MIDRYRSITSNALLVRFIRWPNNHFNNLHFILSLETNKNRTFQIQKAFGCICIPGCVNV